MWCYVQFQALIPSQSGLYLDYCHTPNCTFVKRITVSVISLVRTAPGNKPPLNEEMNCIGHKAGETLVKYKADRLFGNGS